MRANWNSWSARETLYCVCVASASFAFAEPALAAGTLTVLPAGTAATAINDSGVITGWETSGLGFVRTPDGTITTFLAQGGTVPVSISNSGVIAGSSENLHHAFVRDAAGVITNFDVQGANVSSTIATGVNAEGVVVGSYTEEQNIAHSFVRAVDGTIVTFSVREADQTLATGINDAGEIVGYWLGSVEHGFIRSPGGKITSFDVPEGTVITAAPAINAKGDVTGYYLDQTNMQHGFIRQHNGTFTTFDAGAGTPTYAQAININGSVAGFGPVNTKGDLEGFVRTRLGQVSLISAHKTYIYPAGINKDGVVAGRLENLSHHNFGNQGFIWTP